MAGFYSQFAMEVMQEIRRLMLDRVLFASRSPLPRKFVY
jgi:hypothetical protein